MAPPTQQTDHVGEARDRLPGQFANATNLKLLISALVGPSNPTTWGIQELENVLYQLITEMWLDDADGAQLDVLGVILGRSRLEASDDEYSDRLRLQIVINTSKGLPETLIAIVDTLTGASVGVHYFPKQPARLCLAAIGATQYVALDKVHKAAAGGVAVNVQATSAVNPFIYGRARDASGTQTTLTQQHPLGGLGYGVPGAGSGGHYAALHYHTE